jgi:hypothetical protein
MPASSGCIRSRGSSRGYSRVATLLWFRYANSSPVNCLLYPRLILRRVPRANTICVSFAKKSSWDRTSAPRIRSFGGAWVLRWWLRSSSVLGLPEIAMKNALITACVVALAGAAGLGAQSMDERRRAPLVAAPEQSAPNGQSDLQKSTTSSMSQTAKPLPSAQEPETTGLGSPAVGRSSSTAASAAAQDEPSSAAEVRRVRAAVERTLRRTHESSTGTVSRVPAPVGQTLDRTVLQ